MTEPEDARRREDASIRTEQRLIDFMEQYKEDKAASLAWRATIENRLKPLEGLAAPAKAARTAAAIIVASFLTAFGWKMISKPVEWLAHLIQGPHP